ncbi:23S rRNA (adenine(2503)-C(2))-methyltransferase RlmN [Armatimonas sp.]|uniref:23S rRNA (adenine(2503)-C(2))-methyltransferase RlmN n=1 Tax=Armatimonas sp. TaxID=1872638 RepID=UPI00286CC3D3|nr:23S rRNA (adenine(2503)-C(2))-methyltransferase RlmN [Armatimonas sp.]
MMQTLVGHTSAELTELLTTKGLPGYRGKQLGKGLYTRFLRDFEGFTDLSKALREQLAQEFTLAPCTERSIQSAPDGTEKYLLNLPDDEVIEAVYLPYDERTSVCVSSQVGCPMACSFCATGTEGLARNLTAGEIVDQLLFMQAKHPEQRISHLVLMGMGEPLLNLPSVLKALRLIHDEVGLSYRNITVSTIGVVPAMEKLAAENLPITLAVSLHAPNNALRSELVPLNEKYPISRLLEACRDYVETTSRRITFEYVLMAGVNDTEKEAHELGALLRRQPLCAVNTIPYNTTDVAARYQRPTPEAARLFREIVASYGVNITQRYEKGHRIAAACGQLKRSTLKLGSTMRPLPLLSEVPAEVVPEPAA